MPAIVQTVTSYTATEAAQTIGVSRVTIWRAIRDGKLTAHRTGNHVVIFAADLLDYVLSYMGGKGIPQA